MYASDHIIIGLLAFLLGSIPFGVLLAKLFRLTDPRTIGSGNIGATNMLRTGNKKVALLTLLLDGLKGTLPVLLCECILQSGPTLGAFALLAAVLGHCYTPWLKFKGGKGVATMFGGILALHMPIGAIAAASWLLVALVTRYVSLASVVAAIMVALGAAVWLGAYPFYSLVIVAFIVVLKHRPNLQRLRAGTEPKLGAKKHA